MRPEPPTVQFVADRGDDGVRLDQAILRHLHDVRPLSRTRIQAWIDAGIVTVDRRVASRPAMRLRDGSVIVIMLPEGTHRRQPPAPEAGRPLTVLYEDDVLLAVDKPPGMVVHPSYKQSSGTLLNAVLAHLPASRGEPGIITRLDKHTSGIVLIATAPGVHRQVQDDAHNGRVVKEYLALVDGMLTPRHGVIDVPLGRDVADRRRIVPAAGGVTAITRYDVLSTDSRRSLVRCELVTGRTHQIRAHLTARGCPIVGDAVYGNRDGVLGDRQALHAWRLTLPHPLTREPLVLVAAPPHDMRMAGAGLFDALGGASS